MPSRRGFLLWFAFGSAVLVAAPYRPIFKAHFPEFALDTAIAKDGNSGNAGNGSSGNGNSGNGNSGNGGSDSGNGNGNGKGNSNSGSVGSNNDSSGKNNGQTDTDSNGGTTAAARSHIGADGSIDVQHLDGLSERIQNGRYVMKDSKGRTIINRLASKADESRLRSFIH
jgi:hypothetical protein